MPAEIPLVAVGVAALIAVVLLVLLIRARKRRLAETERLRDEHERDLAERAAEHERSRVALERERERAEASAEASRAFIARGMRWEEASHREIAAACAANGLPGVLATNVVFYPAEAREGRRFVAQIDHVLLTAAAAVVIEAKRWQGVVFDNVAPGAVHPAFGALIDEGALEAPFAIQLRRSSAGIDIRVETGAETPATQARRQARRLHALVNERTGREQWFDTCVYYSHPDAVVHARTVQSSDGGATTRMLAGSAELTAFVRSLAKRPRTALSAERIDELAAQLASLGACVERVGAPAPSRT
jgi:hypothetical protein